MVSGLQMDYRRFQSQAQLACYTNERDAIREYDATTPITTNLMGTFKDLDYFEWAKEMDVVSWDNYPGMDTPPSFTAMCHDLMRGIGGNKPFMLMEQTPNQQNWFPFCKVKQPGEVRKLSWQAVAHGADTVRFFQMKQSLGGCERFHGASSRMTAPRSPACSRRPRPWVRNWTASAGGSWARASNPV